MKYDVDNSATRRLIEKFEDSFSDIKTNRFHQKPLVLDLSDVSDHTLEKLRFLCVEEPSLFEYYGKIEALMKERGTW